MDTHYTSEINTQIIISLLKQSGIKKVIASPGATNICFVASIQQDDYFEVYSCVDERSAAYMACGLASESGETVVLSCTGATSSRNYMPGLTEAYYSKLPIIAITSSQLVNKVGHHIAQVTDRSSPPSDTVRYSTTLPIVNNDDDIWDCEIKVNNAILETKRNGGGPVHINVQIQYNADCNTIKLPEYRKIDRITLFDNFPSIPSGRIAIFVGAHRQMSQELTASIDKFCCSNNAVVFCDHTSGYKGKYGVLLSLLAMQQGLSNIYIPDILIHIGEISGDYPTLNMSPKIVWRVNPDGEIRDTFRSIKYVFEINEEHFFNHYNKSSITDVTFYNECSHALSEVRNKLPEIPFSNFWVASRLAALIPDNSTIHFAILNTLRAWNLFDLPLSVRSSCNTGGFGIDGCTSTLIGASLAHNERLYYLVTGDLAFFYDLNVLGNRHTPNRVRILLINNGKGVEFRIPGHYATQFGEDADVYIAAAGHNGNQSSELVKCFAENLGYEYMSASSKEEFDLVYKRFISPELTSDPMIFEIFTDTDSEREALRLIKTIEKEPFSMVKSAKRYTRAISGGNVISGLKAILKKS
ncbi:MAG: thiamine pyrophosphate-binding protein [Rikenellaceae bacterium]